MRRRFTFLEYKNPGFQGVLSAETGPDRTWILTRPLKYYTARLFLITISTGFATDLASIPKILRIIFDVNGKHRESAALHDYLYHHKGKLAGKTWSRWRCDWEFLVAMSTQGVGFLERWAMFIGVAVGGWWAWHDLSKKIKDFANTKL